MSATGNVVPLQRSKAAPQEPRPTGVHPDLVDGWTGWLRENTTADWRLLEWNPSTLVFTGDIDNPRTVVFRCGVAACDQLASARSLCTACGKAHKASGMLLKEFKATFVPVRDRSVTGVQLRCRVQDCPRDSHLWGLCSSHASLRQKDLDRNPSSPLDAWVARQRPYDPVPACRVRGCRYDGRGQHGLCFQHGRRYRQHPASNTGAPVPPSWLEHQAPYLRVHQFSLAPLHPAARLEVLYALQQRDARGQKVDPLAVRRMIAYLAESFDSLTVVAADQLPGRSHVNVDSLIRETHRVVTAAFARFQGVVPAELPVLDMAELGVRGKRGGRTSRSGNLDLTELKQPWLRQVLVSWVDDTKPTTGEVRRAHRACCTAARALDLRPGGGTDMAQLGFADMNAVVDAFRVLPKLDGQPMGNKARSALLSFFFRVLDHSRAAGYLDGMSAYFARHSTHVIAVEETDEDEAGKALPDTVMRQLNANIHLLGQDVTHGRMTPEQVKAMCTAVYQLLRDTGRRPYEIAELRVTCLKQEKGDWGLIWDNRKAKRLRRNLPIASETARAIQAWLEVRETIDLPTGADRYLFPPTGENGLLRHLLPEHVANFIRKWADSIEVIEGEEIGRDGTLLPFDRSLIFPYAFRHSYAQRHADQGIHPDLLRELMDHRSLATTQGYYRISAKRKREAVNIMRVHATDWLGNPAPLSSATAYEARSVSVPFGNCTEASNVKAGGQACPIRFQCAGCGHYRPDPSYLHAVEDQIRALMTDREVALAMDAAEWVVAGFDNEIAAYKKVTARMRDQLDGMDEDERAQVEEASTVLRKVRASTAGRGSVALPMPTFPGARDGVGA
ncbi:tyrosine-type recombinase/integrase [Streptomyces sp. NRRL WC-3742]|uniref:tyrosine-type recombinase/integrase n=1 Tax=Streptomyces sp. NRRL WC-3742 TaxID=1463934 RepID=UPI0004CA0EFE|nr:site-specific integrase [Streptomyces sp. NRRL WC-3742]